MSKEKQIEEIADCVLGGSAEYRLEVAQRVYDKGYRKQAGWISVDEAMPKDGERVLVCCDRCGPDYDVAYWREYSNKWYSRFLSFDAKVTHWKPLPEGPKE